MNIPKIMMILVMLILLAACATKRYPIATELSPAEASLMSCHDLDLEMLKADQIERMINETGEFDGRTVLGFLGDLGIGNGMAKDEARTAVSNRRLAIHKAQVEKGCLESSPSSEDKDTPDKRDPAKQAGQ